MKVHANVTRAVSLADRAQVVESLKGLLPDKQGNWLPLESAYWQDATAALKEDKGRVEEDKLRDFSVHLAASVFVHLSDAWGYLSRSLEAALRGDVSSAIHLVYYAELRGAMSLLASEGLFIGNSQHVALGKQGAESIRDIGSTHKATWSCLREWSRSARASLLCSQGIAPQGAALSEWTHGSDQDMRYFLELVAQDISGYDHLLRNHASYRPSRFRPADCKTGEIVQAIDSVWRLLEPSSTAVTFQTLDMVVLAQILQRFHKGREVKWSEWIVGIAPATSNLETASYIEALKSKDPVLFDSPLMSELFDGPGTTESGLAGFLPPLARALVLLRLATVAAQWLLRDSGQDPSAIRGWVLRLASDRGLWGPSNEPSVSIDLWQDIADALLALEEAGPKSTSEVVFDCSHAVSVLVQAERVVAWSFG